MVTHAIRLCDRQDRAHIALVIGDAGRHARSAVGMGSLPFDISVEVELIVEITDA